MMANSFSTIEALAKDASLMISDKFFIGNRVNRSQEDNISSPGKGGKVTVSIPQAATGQLWNGSGSLSTEDLTQNEKDLEVKYTAAVSVKLTGAQTKYVLGGEQEPLLREVVEPAVSGVVNQAEGFLSRMAVGGYARNLVGTAGNEISTFSDLVAADKAYFQNTKSDATKVGVVTPASYANIANLKEFKSSDYGEDRPAALKRALIADAVNTGFIRSPYLGSFNSGDTGGTLQVKGGSQSGTSVVVDGFTNSSGTVNEGTRITISGVSGTYTVTADTTISSSTATLPLDKALDSSPSDNAGVSVVTYKENVIYNPMSLGAAFLPGATSYSDNVGSYSYNGFGISIIAGDTSTSDLSNTWTFAMDIAARVLQPKMGLVLNGS